MDTKLQISSIMQPSTETITYRSVNIQRQPNGKDCGLFAVAVAVELALNRDPRLCFWDIKNMRNHLYNCFETGTLSPFPLKKARRVPFGSIYKNLVIESVYCTYRMVNNPKQSMIMCDKCTKWFHHTCVGVHPDESIIKWLCNTCGGK